MYSDFIERFRVAEGKTVDHLFFENTTSPATASPAAAAAAPPLPQRCVHSRVSPEASSSMPG